MISRYNCIRLFVTPQIVAHQASLSMGFSREEYWSGLPFPPPGDVLGLGMELASLTSPALVENDNPLQYSCLENSMDGGAWWATVHGVAKSQTRLSNFIFFLSFLYHLSHLGSHVRVEWSFKTPPGRMKFLGSWNFVGTYGLNDALEALDRGGWVTRESWEHPCRKGT